jgi:5-methylthioadenosine/S-adenosylhomocysteine deaminase
VSAPPIRNGAVLVVDGRIAAVGPRVSIPLDEQMAAVDLGDAVLMPGLINVHAHPELSVLRGSLEDLPFHKWIPKLRRIKTGITFTSDDWRDAARWTCAEAAAAGITCIGATEDSDASMHALRDAGMRGIAFREVFAPSPADAAAAMERLRSSVADMHALETGLVRAGVSPHAPYTVCDVLFSAVAAWSREERLPVAVHASESETEHELVTHGVGGFADGLQARGIDTPVRGTSTVDLLKRTGILDCAPLLIHCVRVSDTDIADIEASGSSVAHCPIANARLGHGIAPVQEMIDAGVMVGIGTDSVASNNRIDILEEARVAQIVQRARLLSPTVLPPDALLRLATIDGARALHVDDRVGSLEIGKDADLCAVSLSSVHARPVFDPVTALFMSARGTDVILTMVQGRIIYRDGVHHTLDVAALGERMNDFGARVREAAGPQADAG